MTLTVDQAVNIQDQFCFQTWPRIQILMGQSGADSLLHKVEHFQPSSVKVITAEDVEMMMKTVTYDEVLVASNGAARFYVWVCIILPFLK